MYCGDHMFQFFLWNLREEGSLWNNNPFCGTLITKHLAPTEILLCPLLKIYLLPQLPDLFEVVWGKPWVSYLVAYFMTAFLGITELEYYVDSKHCSLLLALHLQLSSVNTLVLKTFYKKILYPWTKCEILSRIYKSSFITFFFSFLLKCVKNT